MALRCAAKFPVKLFDDEEYETGGKIHLILRPEAVDAYASPGDGLLRGTRRKPPIFSGDRNGIRSRVSPAAKKSPSWKTTSQALQRREAGEDVGLRFNSALTIALPDKN